MKIGHVQASRPSYYDRNPVSKTFQYKADGVAPHGDVARFVYTVAAGKKAYLESLVLRLIRATVAAPVGQWRCEFLYAPGGVGTNYLASLTMVTNVVGDKDSQGLAQIGYMGAGDVLQANTSDNSTGGTIHYQEFAKIVEFDA